MYKLIITALSIVASLGLFALSYCYLGLPLFEAGIIPLCAIVFTIALATLPSDDGHGGHA